MELLIDTWNVLHQTGILPPESAGIGTRGLYALLQRSRWQKERITMVCDGTPSKEAIGRHSMTTVFTGPSRSADEEIMERVASSSSSRSILVVTSDREIIKSVKANGAQHLNAATFLQTLVDDSTSTRKTKIQRPSELSTEKANEWRKMFGITDEVIAELDNTSLPELQKPTVLEKSKNETPKVKKKRQAKSNEPLLPDALLREARKLLGE